MRRPSIERTMNRREPPVCDIGWERPAPRLHDLDYARNQKVKSGCSRKFAATPELIFSSAALRLPSFDRRDQFSASAIQRARFAGSRWASRLHSVARK
jgi:hypothetical protein